MTLQLIGQSRLEPTTSPAFKLGTRVVDKDGKEYLYVKSDSTGLTATKAAVVVDSSYTASMATTTLALYGYPVGVPVSDIAASCYGFIQVKGTCSLYVKASCAANVRINSTATAGAPDDDGTAGAKVIEGAALTTACGGSAAATAAILTYPRVGATL